MKSSLSIAFLINLLHSRDRLPALLELATSLLQEGGQPHLFALVCVGQEAEVRQLSAALEVHKIPLTLLPSHPCRFGHDDWMRQQMQEFVDFFLAQGAICQETRQPTNPLVTPAIAPAAVLPSSYDIYHAQDLISASALTLMQGMGVIETFVYTVQDQPAPDQIYMNQWYERALVAAEQCFCLTMQQRERLQDQQNVAAQLTPFPPRSRVQQRRRRERQVLNDSDLRPSPWHDIARLHFEQYQRLLAQTEAQAHWPFTPLRYA